MSYLQKALRERPMRSRPDFVSLPTSLPTGSEGDGVRAASRAAADLLAGLLTIPNALRSDVQARRFAHGDLSGLSDLELWRERQRAELALVAIERPEDWFRERAMACVQEQERRRKAR